ncbi:MAG: hypothetical protein LBI05_05415 [Planctomycetaceae bacterium]|jgi:hypothetical protein|nr:hypothetical protein [Planctomycetaceae bacterium]
MSEWRFRISPGIIPPSFLERAYFAGWGRVPRLSQTRVWGNELIVSSDFHGSGTIHVPMFHSPLGVVMESTESLLGRPTPYLLVRELARGSLGRFCRRLFDWQMLGFQQTDTLADRFNRLAKKFSSLIVEAPFLPNVEQEFVSILHELALLVLDENEEYAVQSLSWRMRSIERLPVTLGVGMNTLRAETFHQFDAYAKLLSHSFHAVLPMPTWRELEQQPGQIDWERLEKLLSIPSRFGFQVVLGPLLSFSADALPDWLLPHIMEEGYFESRATRFVNSIAERYGYLAHSWILANRFTDQTLPQIPLERSLALIRILAQQLRSRGIESPMMVGIDQPWGEYALQQTPDWEQVQIAETLMGCRDIDTFLLQIDFGCGKYLTLPRDPMSISNMIDQWSFLGKKIYVSFSMPSSGNPIETLSKLPPESMWSEESQRLGAATVLLTLLGKRAVWGIVWSCLQDPAVFSNSMAEVNDGLVTAQQTLKPAFKHFAAARKNLLQ